MAERIPTELIEHIFTYAITIDTPTCLSICLTNKMGQKIASPALYETVGIPLREGENANRSMDLRLERLAYLCHTLLANRGLARMVTSIKHYCDATYDMTIKVPWFADLRLLDRLVDEEMQLQPSIRREIWAAELLSLAGGREQRMSRTEPDGTIPRGPHIEEFYRDLDKKIASARKGVFDEEADSDDIMDTFTYGLPGYLAVLVIACPRLKQIEIEGDPQTFFPAHTLLRRLGENHKATTIGEPTPAGPRLVHIQELSVTFTDPSDNENGVGEFFLLPGLKKLYIKGIAEDMFGNSRVDDADLEELVLESCDGSCGNMAALLENCPKLKDLTITWDDGYYTSAEERYGGAGTLEAEELASTLDAHLPNLERLRIEMPCQWDFDSDQGIEGLDTLRSLKKLHTLTITDCALFGIPESPSDREHLDTLLPDSLRKLEIIVKGDEFIDADKDILTMLGAERIESITIFNQDRTRWLTKDDVRGVKRRASNAELSGQPDVQALRLVEEDD